MVAIIDYGVGNLFSLCSSLQYIGVASVVTADEAVIQNCSHVILPGVGAFADAVEKLRKTGLDKVVMREAASGKPLLGICLGMQMLFDRSYEYGCHEGLGLIPGEVVAMKGRIPDELKIPHIGWNGLEVKQDIPLLKYVKQGDHVYFVHSFFVDGNHESAAAVTEYGLPVCAAAAKGNVMGCQFHPEKSGEVGLRILKAFCEIEKKE